MMMVHTRNARIIHTLNSSKMSIFIAISFQTLINLDPGYHTLCHTSH